MRTPALFVSALLLAAQPVFAAPAATDKESTYDIEVLVIENRLPELVGDEILSQDPSSTLVRGLDKAVLPEPSGAEPYLRTVAAPVLERDGQYRVLSHAQWQQTVESNPKVPVKPVRIVSLGAAAATELDGPVRFSMSRFLHLDVNLVYRPQGLDPAVAPIYRISEQRRIRSQETQYFDHPQFGVLVRVMPVQKPELETKP